MKKRVGAAVAVCAVAVGLSVSPIGAGANNSIKDCTTTDQPSNNWTTEGTQKGSCNSSHPETTTAVSNPGGKQPPGKQP